MTGLLFRPDDGRQGQQRPAVLCPHGHGGRLQDYGESKMAALIESGAEKHLQSGRFPKLARCAQLARMGCVCFIFDMLGYADSTQISYQLAHRFAKQRPHMEGKDRWGLFSAQAEMRLQSIMGIQTWNSIRCLDFLESLLRIFNTLVVHLVDSNNHLLDSHGESKECLLSGLAFFGNAGFELTLASGDD